MASPFANLSAQERQNIKRESKYSHKYRQLYSELLAEKKDVLEAAWNQAAETDEARLIEEIKQSEFTAVAVGVGCGLATLAAIRLGTPVLIRRIGGEEKIIKMIKADEEAKRLGTYKYQAAFRWTVEGCFSFWLGRRAYHYQSKRSNGAYEKIVKIPLCSGKSVLADGLCDEWVDITTNQVPKAFWKNLQQKDNLTDEQAWTAIVKFSNNCIKRRAYERLQRQEVNWPTGGEEDSEASDAQIVSLPTNVPLDVELTESEAAKLVDDTSS